MFVYAGLPGEKVDLRPVAFRDKEMVLGKDLEKVKVEAKVAGHEREQIAGLGEGIVPLRPVPSPLEIARAEARERVWEQAGAPELTPHEVVTLASLLIYFLMVGLDKSFVVPLTVERVLDEIKSLPASDL